MICSHAWCAWSRCERHYLWSFINFIPFVLWIWLTNSFEFANTYIHTYIELEHDLYMTISINFIRNCRYCWCCCCCCCVNAHYSRDIFVSATKGGPDPDQQQQQISPIMWHTRHADYFCKRFILNSSRRAEWWETTEDEQAIPPLHKNCLARDEKLFIYALISANIEHVTSI